MADRPQRAIRAVYMRGGTSRALVFHAADLPPATADDRSDWNALFLAALGSPDPGGRQLDGLGGGISSLSKIAVVAPSVHAEADVDFTFAQVSVTGTSVGYKGNCGNISSAIGPFAVDEGLVPATGETALVRIFNTNTRKLIHARFPLLHGRAAVEGDMELQGVAGTGAPVRLDFMAPGGAVTGCLLPTGAPMDILPVPGVGDLAVSLVDAANPVVFVAAGSLGIKGPDIVGDAAMLARLDAIRIAASLRMGIAATAEEAITVSANLPLVAIVFPCDADHADIGVRMISAGQLHKATPLTGAMCLAVAARLDGTVVQRIIGARASGDDLRIAHASGVLPVAATVVGDVALHATVYRTARRLMEGRVLVPERALALNAP